MSQLVQAAGPPSSAASAPPLGMFHGRYDVGFASRHWSTWGHDRVIELLGRQRNLYAHLHDQTLRMLDEGLVASEIAEAIQLPPALEGVGHARFFPIVTP
ncbi:hypothetical protein ACFWCB_15600 [Streptomyces sp. NPDC060048]|uniref:hypothetical protein n=1 Tax=unclassified Streptomyces TaxID=2593676 RepID=UPI003692BD29